MVQIKLKAMIKSFRIQIFEPVDEETVAKHSGVS